jgi:hypothetical protein
VAPPEFIREALASAGASEIVFIAQQCLEAGAWDHALALCESCAESGDPGVRLCRAVALFVAGQGEAAAREVDAVLDAHPDKLAAKAVKAQILARSGERRAAVDLLCDLVERYPDYPGAMGLLSTLLLQGPHYREVVRELHDKLRPRTYLEIGVESGATLTLARYADLAIGVDPAQNPMRHPLPPGAKLFHVESDAFFAAHSRSSLLGARRVDLGFIDGMHRFENALRDFIHVEAWAHAGGTILLHDCLPIHPRPASRERSSKFWVGDTWKVVLALAYARPDLRIRTLLCPPSGLVVVRRLNPGSSALADRFDELVARFAPCEWQHAPGQFPAEFSAIASDARGLNEALGGS